MCNPLIKGLYACTALCNRMSCVTYPILVQQCYMAVQHGYMAVQKGYMEVQQGYMAVLEVGEGRDSL